MLMMLRTRECPSFMSTAVLDLFKRRTHVSCLGWLLYVPGAHGTATAEPTEHDVPPGQTRSLIHNSELTRLRRQAYGVLCLNKKTKLRYHDTKAKLCLQLVLGIKKKKI